MDDDTPTKLSTSALAKQLDIPVQQLFSTLKDYRWIRKIDDGWALSSKGEFEGGEYVHSKRYGRYIVWPPDLADHPLLQAVEDNRHLSATVLGKSYGLTAREVNRLLAELGWLKHGVQGWELTSWGEQNGGIQLENEASASFYVVWPQAVTNAPALSARLKQAASIFGDEQTIATDLFADQTDWQGDDGHSHKHKLHLQVCQWLYLAGLAHACHKRLPVDEVLFADFYLPAAHIYIECWVDENSTALAQRMKRKAFYESTGFTVIDLEGSDGQQLDEVLTRQLRKHGVRIY